MPWIPNLHFHICLKPEDKEGELRDRRRPFFFFFAIPRAKEIMMKLVLKVDLSDSKSKKKAMQAVSAICGVNSLSISMEKKTLTVVGDVDPVEVVCKLRKLTDVEIETAGPNKEEEKKKEEGKEKNKSTELINYYNNLGYYCYPYYSY